MPYHPTKTVHLIGRLLHSLLQDCKGRCWRPCEEGPRFLLRSVIPVSSAMTDLPPFPSVLVENPNFPYSDIMIVIQTLQLHVYVLYIAVISTFRSQNRSFRTDCYWYFCLLLHMTKMEAEELPQPHQYSCRAKYASIPTATAEHVTSYAPSFRLETEGSQSKLVRPSSDVGVNALGLVH